MKKSWCVLVPNLFISSLEYRICTWRNTGVSKWWIERVESTYIWQNGLVNGTTDRVGDAVQILEPEVSLGDMRCKRPQLRSNVTCKSKVKVQDRKSIPGICYWTLMKHVSWVWRTNLQKPGKSGAGFHPSNARSTKEDSNYSWVSKGWTE